MNVHKRRTAEDAVNQVWLEKVVSEMLADTRRAGVPLPTPPAARAVVDEVRPARHERRARHSTDKPARDGYGRPIRPPMEPAPIDGGCPARPGTPRTAHPLGTAGKVLLGVAITGVDSGGGFASGGGGF